MTIFKEFTTYATRSVSKPNTVFGYYIIRRTAKTVWINVHGLVVARRLFIEDGVEAFRPLGNYNTAPVIRTTDLVDAPKTEEAAPAPKSFADNCDFSGTLRRLAVVGRTWINGIECSDDDDGLPLPAARSFQTYADNPNFSPPLRLSQDVVMYEDEDGRVTECPAILKHNHAVLCCDDCYFVELEPSRTCLQSPPLLGCFRGSRYADKVQTEALITEATPFHTQVTPDPLAEDLESWGLRAFTPSARLDAMAVSAMAEALGVTETDVRCLAQGIANSLTADKAAGAFMRLLPKDQSDLMIAYGQQELRKVEQFNTKLLISKEAREVFALTVLALL